MRATSAKAVNDAVKRRERERRTGKQRRCILLLFSGGSSAAGEVAKGIAEDLRKRTSQEVKALSLAAFKRLAAEFAEFERVVAVPLLLRESEVCELKTFAASSHIPCVVASSPFPDANISKAILERVREAELCASASVVATAEGVESEGVSWRCVSHGIPDELFLRSKGGLTRREIRAIVVSKAEVRGGEKVLDVGTGSGSVAVEFARLGCEVVAVEKDEQNLEVARKNIARFGLSERIKLIYGRMEDLKTEEILSDGEEFDVIFVGGTDNLEKFFGKLVSILRQNGKLIVAAVRFETASKALSLFKESGLHCELLNIWLSKGKKLGAGTVLAPSYPIFLFFGEKK
ncbi:MAG: precorrin-6Y C5,15-methyltransferase (decarboxylating) subunit CbiT [Candidatus Methanospirare jalkutatii]|nr:precorrin-6Y C5,15-methyltransferase (decarboxylating) subunit CbiT [Candidatus Methanospirare jalkutatii]